MSWLDPIKYLPIRFRRTYYDGEIKGPYFSKKRPLQFNMNDCVLRFDAPWHSYLWRVGEGLSEGGICRNDNTQFSRDLSSFNGSFMNTDRWGRSVFFARSWIFCAPWFIGYKASLTMSASFVGPLTTEQHGSNDRFNGQSFFHPNVFENALADYLRSRYGHSKNGAHHHYYAPVDWQVLPLANDMQAAFFNFESRWQYSPGNCKKTHHIAFPISEQRFVLIKFSFGMSVNDRYYPQLKELADSIIETIRFEPSEAMVSQLQALRDSGVDTRLSTSFPPIKWQKQPEPGTLKIENE